MLRPTLLLLLVLTAVTSALNAPLYGLNYNSRQGPDWDPSKCKSQAQVDADMVLLKALSPRVRIYSLTDCNQGAMVLEAAKKAGLQVWLGMWVDAGNFHFAVEQAALETLVQAGAIDDATVIGIHVGSETLYRDDVSPETVIANIQTVKAYLRDHKINIPVATADVIDKLVQYPAVIQAGDIVLANAFPFWELADINTAMVNLDTKLTTLRAVANGIDIYIGETGWASDGATVGSSPTSAANHATYLADFYVYATERQLPYFYFAAFDDTWKSAGINVSDTVEAHFGLYNSSGQLKPSIAALTLPSVTPFPTTAPSSPAATSARNTVGGGSPTAPSTSSSGHRSVACEAMALLSLSLVASALSN
ncbi:hypothetical protein SPRG_07535 [Saprolegnia parasitica CBS 223.65]|uniref:glucan endo-1,3-beta-D-glucosidase n=1 Tax=Saprolegnia parasitica (strain CBS 223.65) TaxID=695850 RepID=A0A067CL72_SAPPC|nr:hypothetical protein SPRG_07535 [Saprolegnia parasitica CBS 223.65]KDO27286.1 hypothetical protein SPRG_07535 [Saprolegnia parasitica CBS 223.65]|eukprot:XP_012202061.1 hypothetical protein SPRG_07535 [Saprolegnia parasitica CBS 223.65]